MTYSGLFFKVVVPLVLFLVPNEGYSVFKALATLSWGPSGRCKIPFCMVIICLSGIAVRD